MLAKLWPMFALEIQTPRLLLRLPNEQELAALAELAARGVHGADERPFLTPWAEGSAEDRARFVLAEHWQQLGSWSAARWNLGLGAFDHAGAPLGIATLRAQDFAVRREVTTSSWLGVEHQGVGFGTEMRQGLLALAFAHLGATDALTLAFQDNARSQGVSRRLGYQFDGISRDARDGEVVVSDRLRLTRGRWSAQARVLVEIRGLDEALELFALARK